MRDFLENMTQLNLKRSTIQAGIFYLVYSALGLALVLLTGFVIIRMKPGIGDVEVLEMLMGGLWSIYCCIIYYLIWRKKKLGLSHIAWWIATGLVAFLSGLTAMIIVALLTSVDDPEVASKGLQASEQKPDCNDELVK